MHRRNRLHLHWSQDTIFTHSMILCIDSRILQFAFLLNIKYSGSIYFITHRLEDSHCLISLPLQIYYNQLSWNRLASNCPKHFAIHISAHIQSSTYARFPGNWFLLPLYDCLHLYHFRFARYIWPFMSLPKIPIYWFILLAELHQLAEQLLDILALSKPLICCMLLHPLGKRNF